MLPRALDDRLADLTDDLIADGGVEAACLASIFLRARAALANGTLVRLCLQVWRAEVSLIDPPPRVPRER